MLNSNTRYILMDVEGTTTDIQFVHQVLFPYSTKHLPDYIRAHAHDPLVKECLKQVEETINAEKTSIHSSEEPSFPVEDKLDIEAIIQTLSEWIEIDRKHPALKQLQGFIWKSGFEQGHYHGHVYPDVPITLKKWQEQGITMGIYSSGSVQAQQLLFRHSIEGDLTPYFSNYFDTQVGAKKEVQAYRNILKILVSQIHDLRPAEILFLSDVVAELDAAKEAGFQVTQLLRNSTIQAGPHPTSPNLFPF